MEVQAKMISPTLRRAPWNKGKLIGQSRRCGRSMFGRSAPDCRLQMDGRLRDLAMFNLAIDSKLRGCDVIALRVEHVAPSGYAVNRAAVRQKKTGRPVRFELTEQPVRRPSPANHETGRCALPLPRCGLSAWHE